MTSTTRATTAGRCPSRARRCCVARREIRAHGDARLTADGARLDRDARRRGDLVLHAARQVQATASGGELHNGAPAARARVDGNQRRFGDRVGAARIVRARAAAGGDQLGGDSDQHWGERHDLVGDRRQVTVRERDEPPGADAQALAGCGLPLDLTHQDGAAHVQRAPEAREARRGEVERLVVDQQADDRAVGGVDDRLPGPREPERVLGIADRPRLVEAVENRPGGVRRRALVGRAAQPQIAVADREHRLEGRQPVKLEPVLDDLPRVAQHADAVVTPAPPCGAAPAPCARGGRRARRAGRRPVRRPPRCRGPSAARR
jgi:hypothetical protein